MNVFIERFVNSDNVISVDITDGKREVYIGKGRSGSISVCLNNASHRAYGGPGRTFWSFAEIEAAYKSTFMKDAIKLARETLETAE